MGFAWALCSALLAMRLLLSACALRSLLRQATQCQDAKICSAADDVSRRLGLAATPPLLVSPHVVSPMVLSLGTRALLLPSQACRSTEWTSVLTHELAHVVRRDGWTRLWAELVRILLPIQPLVWMLRRDDRMACEEACDDLAVASGINPIQLAAAIATWVQSSRQIATMAIGISGTRARALRLLQPCYAPESRLPRGLTQVSITAAVLLITAVTHQRRRAAPLGQFERTTRTVG